MANVSQNSGLYERNILVILTYHPVNNDTIARVPNYYCWKLKKIYFSIIGLQFEYFDSF